MSLAAGTKLGSYEIVAPLGAGGMGHVYRARDPRLDREVAIKVLPAGTASDPGALARFEREAMSVARLTHPNILSIFEFARDGGTTFVVTELVDGETLRARLSRDAGRCRHAALSPVPSDVSPDGKQLAYYSIGETQEDIFVGPPGGPLRRVTDDAPRDRAPVFTPDGRSPLFYSTRDGDWAAWAIGIDGGGLRKVASESGGVTYPIFSPKGDAIAFSGLHRNSFTAAFPPVPGASPIELPGTTLGTDSFKPTDWSRDGTRIAGLLNSISGLSVGVAVYDLGSHTLTKLTDDDATEVHWLAGGRAAVLRQGRS